MLNRPARIPVDRLLSEKALDFYHFVEKVVKNPGQLMIKERWCREQSGNDLTRDRRREHRFGRAYRSKQIHLPLSDE